MPSAIPQIEGTHSDLFSLSACRLKGAVYRLTTLKDFSQPG
jgi:hypothetical protein